MKQKITVENIQGLDKDKFYLIQLDHNEVSEAEAEQLSTYIRRARITAVITFFPVKFADKITKLNEMQDEAK